MANIEDIIKQGKICICHLGGEKDNKEKNCKCTSRVAALVKIDLNGKPLDAVLDTGSEKTVVHKRALDGRGIKIMPDESIRLTAASGMLSALGTAEVKINIAGTIISPEKCIAASLSPLLGPIDMILGMDILSKCRTLRLYFDNDRLVHWEIVNYDPAAKRSDLKMDMDVSINGARLAEAILDTGCDKVIIKKSVIADLITRNVVTVKQLKDQCICSMMADGSGQLIPIEGTVKLDLKIVGEELKQVECQVVKALPCDMIVGTNIMSKFEAIEINFSEHGDETIRFLKRRPEPTPTAAGQQQRNNEKPATTSAKSVPKANASSSRGNEAKPNHPKATAPRGKGDPATKSASKRT